MTQTDLPAPPLSRLDRLRAAHNFLLQHAFYPLLLSTLLSFAFFITYICFTGRLHYRFLVFNLFLAWIPYGLSLVALHLHESRNRDRAITAIVWLAWLAMFPNAPYILTDLVHLGETRPLAWWFDMGMVTSFALAGCFCGIVSLRIMHDIVRPRIGFVGGWLFVTTVATLAGFGIYVGRFLRWNSWDLITHPHYIAAQLIPRMMNPLAHPRTIGVTLMFGGLTLVMYVMMTSLARPISPAQSRNP